MCGECTSTLQHEEGSLSNYHQRITSQAMNTSAGCCDTACTARATPHKNWEEELASTLRILKSTRRSACPCVWRGRIKGEDIVATVLGDGITVDGERQAVEFLIKMTSRKDEIKKQVIGEDPNLEKSGRKLNRFIDWIRDGITIEADQRHVREILKGLELERANHSAASMRRGEEGLRTAPERMEARGRINVDRDRPRPSTSGTT